MNKYGLRLKELRESHGYTQEALAKMLGTSRSRISMYEQGKRQPDFEMQEAIADLFNVSIDYLFGREDEEGNRTELGQLIDVYEYRALLDSLDAEEKQEVRELFIQVLRLAPENRSQLLALLKSLVSKP